MKNNQTSNIFFFSGLFLLTIFFTSCDKRFRINGSGVINTVNRPLSGFDRIDANGSYDIYLHQSEVSEIQITTDDNIITKVQTFVQDGTLRIEMDDDYSNYRYSRMELHVYSPVYSSVELNGAVNTSTVDTIHAPVFSFHQNGSGNGLIYYSGSEVEMIINGSGRIEANGLTSDVRLEINGSGKIDALDLIATHADAEIHGSGDIYVNASSTLDAEIDGSGDIRYVGQPTVTSRISGSGNVSPY